MKTMKDVRRFDEWKAEVLRIAELLDELGPSLDLDWDAWREDFESGHTPAGAWRNQFECAQSHPVTWRTP